MSSTLFLVYRTFLSVERGGELFKYCRIRGSHSAAWQEVLHPFVVLENGPEDAYTLV
jgi:hypothetical protein